MTFTTQAQPYQEFSASYGREVRDQAIMLQALNLLKKRSQAPEWLKA